MQALSFGEILWDIINEKPYIGGAPFNLSAHLAKMGLHSSIISSVGNDELGNEALNFLEKLDINKKFVDLKEDIPTGKVLVEFTKNNEPSYKIIENTAWDNINPEKDSLNEILKNEWDVFCFGTLAQRSESNRNLLYYILDNIKSKHIFYDVNLRQNYYEKAWIEYSFSYASIVKVNDEEADFLSNYIFGKKLSYEEFAKQLEKKFNTKIICITRGAEGVLIYHKGELNNIPGEKVDVADTVGAGDSFSAAFLFACLSGKSPKNAAQFAIKVASFVSSCYGAIPDYNSHIKNKIREIKNN